MSQLNKQHLKWASIAEARLKDAFPNCSTFSNLCSASYSHGHDEVRLEISVVDLPHGVSTNYIFNNNTPTHINAIHLTIKDIVTKLKEELNAKVNKQTAPAVGSIPAELIQCHELDAEQSSAVERDSPENYREDA